MSIQGKQKAWVGGLSVFVTNLLAWWSANQNLTLREALLSLVFGAVGFGAVHQVTNK